MKLKVKQKPSEDHKYSQFNNVWNVRIKDKTMDKPLKGNP